ncbi:MAG: sigma-54 dependent transcriptional regulator [Pirellulales bacterium]
MGSDLDNMTPDGAERIKVLIADDDVVTLRVLQRYLAAAGFECVTASDGREALSRLSHDVSLALFDLEMPHASGLECLQQARTRFPDLAVMVVSGKGQIADAVAAMKQGAADYLTKPFDRDELIARVNQAARTAGLARENRDLRAAVAAPGPASDFVAQAPCTQRLLRLVAKVAPLDSTVMITGESGTGKTTVARLIHQWGPRREGPFVTVNCASLPRDLVEAELFGHAKGAFTGAVSDRPGRAEIADKGTLFLDEIGDLPLELQPKLLTFLQDRTFQRIGSNKVYTVDVRVIAATHQDLAAMCREKRFREDLFYRLNVLSLHMPALRERPEDIGLLVQHVLQRIGRRRGAIEMTCDEDAAERLRRYGWPGNVRELENVLERASAFCESQRIRVDDLWFPSLGGPPVVEAKPPEPPPAPAPLEPPPPEPTTQEPTPPELTPEPTTLAGRTLDELERQAILDTLAACRGNKAEAARRLGISEKSIYNKMKRFEI